MRLTDVSSFALLAVVVAAAGFALVSSAADGQRLEAVTDPQGNLHVPSRYRSDYEFLGAWAITADKGGRIKPNSHCLCNTWHERRLP